MDLLGDSPALDLSDRHFRIYSRNFARPPQYIGEGAVIRNSLISEGCHVEGTVENSILFGGVTVAKGAVVRVAVVMEDVEIGEGAGVYYAIVDTDVVVEAGATVGEKRASRSKIAVVAKGERVSVKEDQ